MKRKIIFLSTIMTILLIFSFVVSCKKENNDKPKICFGSYPQTIVSDRELCLRLNEMAGDLPISEDLGKWTDYNYYIEGEISSFMYYQDIDYNFDGIYDYRGVYFTEYRPDNIYDESFENKKYDHQYVGDRSPYFNTFQDDNEYYVNRIYWFNYNPIEWNILDESDGKKLVIANLILDSQDYYPSRSESVFEHNGGIGHASNYELSNIRKWLNDNFYNTAFNYYEKLAIETTEVDNSEGWNYACSNTNDKIFLLSSEEVTKYVYDKSKEDINSSVVYSQQCKGSDYAKCQGLQVFNRISLSNEDYNVSMWRLRTPDKGELLTIKDSGHQGDSYAYDTFIGVRPACWIDYKKLNDYNYF